MTHVLKHKEDGGARVTSPRKQGVRRSEMMGQHLPRSQQNARENESGEKENGAMRRGAYLVARLVQFLGIEGGADAEREARVHLGVVGDGRHAFLVDLGLFCAKSISIVFGYNEESTHLCKRRRVKLIAPGNLQSDHAGVLGVVRRPRTRLDA